MSLGLLGKKLGMSQIFDKDGKLVPVTYIQAGPCYVLQRKSKVTDGYEAVQLGYEEKREKNTTKPLMGHYKKAGTPPLRFVREFRMEDAAEEDNARVPDVGQTLDVSLFAEGDHIDVVGISIGRGFASPIKRWHVRRGPETHGSMYHRRAGSQGASSYPSKTWKNKKGAGHMGAAKSTVVNLVVVKSDPEKNLLIVRGSIPGHVNSYVVIRKTVRHKKATRQMFLLATSLERQKAAASKTLNPIKASKKGGK